MTKKKGEDAPGGNMPWDQTREPLEKVLGELAPRRKRLDSLDEDILDLMSRVETAMRDHFSVRITTPIESELHDETGYETFVGLAYGRHDNKWQLLIVEGETGDPEHWKTTTLVSAPRDMRARVFREGFVEKLIRDAVVQLDEQIAGREIALANGTRIADALDPNRVAGPVVVR